MRDAGIQTFDKTLQVSQRWINEIMLELGIDDRQQAYVALRGTLHALRDRLPLNETVQLGAQLPMLVRGLYYDGWPTSKPVPAKTIDQFVTLASEAMARPIDVDPEEAVRCVLRVLDDHVSIGEMDDVIACLPEALADLWAA